MTIMSDTAKHIFISAGEASGDLLGADLAKSLLQKDPSLKLTGMGLQRMRDAGVDIIFNPQQLSVVGIVEALIQLPRILWMWRKIKNYIKKTQPDLIILIDFPDTHFRFLKTAKKLGIPILYYVSPQIWVWRSSRIYTLKKYIAHMAVLFSFEDKWYRDVNIPVTFVGHPLATLAKPTLSVEASYDFFKLDPTKPIVTLFPGSRTAELKNHLPIMIEAVKKIAVKKSDTQFVLMLAPHFDKNQLSGIGYRLSTNNDKNAITLASAHGNGSNDQHHIQIVQNNLYDLLQITNAAIAVSGTVTLEIALMRVPHCIIYRLNPLTAWLAKFFIRTKYVGLSNIVAQHEIAKEFLQDAMTSDAMTTETLRLLEKKHTDCPDIRSAVSIPNQSSSDEVADIAIMILRSKI